MTMTTKELLALVGKWRERSDKERSGPVSFAMRTCADELEAALSVAQGQGFVMVPREATPQMVMAFQSGEPGDKSFWGCYRAMLAAAPAQPDGVGK